jgi:UDP-N-acetylmuramoyl-L-alanyl-D-glutamate--2,6-diaminopimelate ligase
MTGFILAMVSKPAYDPNQVSGRINQQLWRDLSTDPEHPLPRMDPEARQRQLFAVVRRAIQAAKSESPTAAASVRSTAAGTEARFVTPSGDFDVRIRLISTFNVMNALAAAGVAVSQGIGHDAIAAGLEQVDRVEGRLQLVDGGQDFAAVIDYAHTPDALEKVIAALRKLKPDRKSVV